MENLDKVAKEIQDKINKLIEERNEIDKVLIRFGQNSTPVTEGKRRGRPKSDPAESAQGVSNPK